MKTKRKKTVKPKKKVNASKKRQKKASKPRKISLLKMKKRELNKFKDLLIKEKEKVILEMEHIEKDSLNRSAKEASGDISAYTYHMADIATDNYDREFSLNMATNEQKVLFKIEEALQRIKEGSYGICEGCNKSIGKRRLTALCFTNLCLKCQKESESNPNNFH